MRHKKLKPPILLEAQKNLRADECPRYINVPSPAPCHANEAGVVKQSKWASASFDCKVEGKGKVICSAIRGQPQRGLRCFISTTAWTSSVLGPFGPGLRL